MGKASDILFRKKTTQVMRLLEQHGEWTSTKVWQAVGHTTTALMLLDELTSIGLVKRTVLQDKRRSVVWTLTPMGKKWCRMLDWVDSLDRGVSAKIDVGKR